MVSFRSIVLLTTALAVVSTTTASAEGFIDAYLGAAFTDDARIKGDFAGSKNDFDNSSVGGIRGGYWFRQLPWLGVAGDISSFAPHADEPARADIVVTPISPLLMVRLPIAASDELPGGFIQPYAAIGPALFVSTTRVRFVGSNFVDTTADVGLDTRAGLKVHVLPWLSVFTEYRYTRFDPNWRDEVNGWNVDYNTELRTHHVNVGVGFHFGGPKKRAASTKARRPESVETAP